jgi:hypothetical protein
VNEYWCYQPSTHYIIISHNVQITKTNGVILDYEPESTPLDLIGGPPMPQVFSLVTLTLFLTFSSIVSPLTTSLSIASSLDSMPIKPIELKNLLPTLSPSPLAHTHDVVVPIEPLSLR